MFRVVFLSCCAAAVLSGCSEPSSAASPERQWWAHENHGDKPGTAWVLGESGGRIVSGQLHITEPEKAADLKSGVTYPFEISTQSGAETVFKVELENNGKKDVRRFKIVWKASEKADERKATIVEVGETNPMELVFHPLVKQK